mmetsp:Transcript_7236/g.10222  ORF Transcript_7236/g.10222 Transcript_7236/m.10222 type:complete len:95 (-) Transcript_7236:31-315(-)
MKVFDLIKNDPVRMMSLQIDSGDIHQMVTYLQSCTTSVPLRERKELAQTAINAVCEFVRFGAGNAGNADKARMVAVPGLPRMLRWNAASRRSFT